MKSVILIFIIISITLVNGFGQNYDLILKSKTNGKEKIVHQGKHLKVQFYDNNTIRGKLTIINDSIIMLGANIILIKKVKEIRVKPLLINITGGIFIPGGLFASEIGIEIIILGGWATQYGAVGSSLGGASIVGGIFLTAVGIALISEGIRLLVFSRKYKVYDWDFLIVSK